MCSSFHLFKNSILVSSSQYYILKKCHWTNHLWQFHVTSFKHHGVTRSSDWEHKSVAASSGDGNHQVQRIHFGHVPLSWIKDDQHILCFNGRECSNKKTFKFQGMLRIWIVKQEGAAKLKTVCWESCEITWPISVD